MPDGKMLFKMERLSAEVWCTCRCTVAVLVALSRLRTRCTFVSWGPASNQYIWIIDVFTYSLDLALLSDHLHWRIVDTAARRLLNRFVIAGYRPGHRPSDLSKVSLLIEPRSWLPG